MEDAQLSPTIFKNLDHRFEIAINQVQYANIWNMKAKIQSHYLGMWENKPYLQYQYISWMKNYGAQYNLPIYYSYLFGLLFN